MDKRELKKIIEKKHTVLQSTTFKPQWTKVLNIDLPTLMSLINQLDEPGKPVVPWFVADFYEEWKNDLTQGVFKLITSINYYSINDKDQRMAEWLEDLENDALNVLASMKNGYLVVKEPKYIIKLGDESYLQRYEIDNINVVTPFRIVGHLKEVAVKFENKEKAEKVAELVEGEVEELEE